MVAESLVASEDPDQLVDPIVVGGHVVVGDRPVVTEAVLRLALEIIWAEAQRDAAPMVGTAAEHSRPPPPKLRAGTDGVGLSLDLPATVARVELAERTEFGGGSPARRRVRRHEHRRVLRGVPFAARFEHDHARARVGERMGSHTATRARADDADVVYGPGLNAARGWRLLH